MKNIVSSIICILLFLPCYVFSQTLISGKISDSASRDALVGVQVYYPHATAPVGSLTDELGYFELSIDRVPPFEIEISLFGYQKEKVVIERNEDFVEIFLEKESDQIRVSSLKGGLEVESVSRTQQLKQQSPVSVYNLGVLEIFEAPYPDYFQQLSNLKEIQVLPSSLTLGAVSTRGFADIQNWRFVQYIDGIDMNTPGLNYSLGNLLGTSVLDMRNMEVISGTVSALYGANAFNGILSMSTKNPFDYKGLSAFVTGGMNKQTDLDPSPFYEVGVRYGWTMGEKWAAKINFSAFQGEEWEGRDASFHLRPEFIPFKETLLNLPQGHPNYDAVHVYGDEVTVGVDLAGDGNLVDINRTGFQERDLIDYDVNNIKANGGLYFRPTQDVEASYVFNIIEADAILRHTTVYPFVNTFSQVHKLELKGRDYFIRGYYSAEDAKDSYQMLGTGAFIQEVLKPSATWGQEYGAAFRGEIAGVGEGDHSAARMYADRDIPGPESTTFQRARQQTLDNPDIATGGSKFTDQSSMLHFEGAVEYDSLGQDLKLQIGGSFRNYRLNSLGNLFNDGPLGFNGPINYQDMGLFAQARKSYLEDKLLFQLALRLDKNSNFKARLSPRFSGVWLLGGEGEHTLRFSAQQGFRNPASQEGYIALDLGRLFLLGGLLENIESFSHPLPGGGQARGVDILESLVTLTSLQAFLASGQSDPSLLVPQQVPVLRQESITSFELGYRAQVGTRTDIDIHLYRNRYKNFVQRINAYSTLVNRVFSIYSNIEEDITSIGGGVNISTLLPGDHKVSGNYTFASFDSEEAEENNPGFLPGFNFPQNQVKVQFSNRKVYKNWGYSVNFRWSGEYVWESPFGQGIIPAYSTLDAAILREFPRQNVKLKLGGSNLIGSYTPIYGGPDIGRQFFLTIIYGKY